jgi:thioredoxin-like negative regulator of GroEL
MCVIAVNDENFQAQAFGTSQLVLVEFSRPGTNDYGEPDPGARTGAILDELALEFQGRVKMLRIPMDSCAALVDRFKVTTAPTIIFIKNDNEVERTSDFHLKFWFRTKLNELLAG